RRVAREPSGARGAIDSLVLCEAMATAKGTERAPAAA
ncbi:MAG: hypothetical protein QOJ85_4288, partial [Solirubrobacteraceae bacterium]|nr:hypothetical protein [Solirubrobacteraceae bacterium]